MRGVVLDLHAQTPYVDVNYLFLAEIVLAPNAVKDIATVQRHVRVGEEVFDYLKEDYEFEPGFYRKLSEDGQFISYFHDGFWLAMETRRDKTNLERMWANGTAPWRIFS